MTDRNATEDASSFAPGVELRDWQGSTFDPENLRFFSILPPEDDSEAYCVRHEREMQAIDPVVHHAGALYTTAKGWHVYSCRACRVELGARAVPLYQRYLAAAFEAWDDTEQDVLGGAFEYVGEGTPEDAHRRGGAGRHGEGGETA